MAVFVHRLQPRPGHQRRPSGRLGGVGWVRRRHACLPAAAGSILRGGGFSWDWQAAAVRRHRPSVPPRPAPVTPRPRQKLRHSKKIARLEQEPAKTAVFVCRLAPGGAGRGLGCDGAVGGRRQRAAFQVVGQVSEPGKSQHAPRWLFAAHGLRHARQQGRSRAGAGQPFAANGKQGWRGGVGLRLGKAGAGLGTSVFVADF